MKHLLELLEHSIKGSSEESLNEVLYGFFEGLPFPAWIKVVGDDGSLKLIKVNEKCALLPDIPLDSEEHDRHALEQGPVIEQRPDYFIYRWTCFKKAIVCGVVIQDN